jgi:hypothetical protein
MSTDKKSPVDAAATSEVLPDDPVVLKQMIMELLESMRDLRQNNAQLQHRLDVLLVRQAKSGCSRELKGVHPENCSFIM